MKADNKTDKELKMVAEAKDVKESKDGKAGKAGKEIPELSFLLKSVEKVYGRRVATTTDFESLSVVIEHEIGERLSASTLKRLWGYVGDRRVPRLDTLDILAKYCGKKDFKGFCEWMVEESGVDSQFFTVRYIRAADLAAGDKLSLGWGPDRLVKVEHLGLGRFRVLSSANSKLKEGDEFEADGFMLGCPLYITAIYREGKVLPAYVAGRVHGLSVLEKG